ncbi:MAG: site-specific DNA-methyltransferase [bacterium]
MLNCVIKGDCLFALREEIALNSVDLIYLDPPFFVGRVLKGRRGCEASFEDSKKFWAEKGLANKDIPEWIKHIARPSKERAAFASYLHYMMERLQACHKVLMNTGSIYLHCDWRTSHYLKMVMDEVFGEENFRNEIIWRRRTNTVKAISRKFSLNTDSIFFYSKTAKYRFNIQYTSYGEDYLSRFKYQDEHGRYRWNVMATYSEERLDKLMQEGKARFGARSKYPEFKQYEWELKGRPIENVWTDIDMINAMGKERVGYPTQKPEELLERIIKASSNENDLVLDPFCGCGTTMIAAHKLNRKWIGIDISETAFNISIKRLEDNFGLRRGIDFQINKDCVKDGKIGREQRQR